MSAKHSLWWMVAVLLVATALRFISFGDVPPGLYHDEAYHGLDVLEILNGRLSLYFPANNGREPLFIYLTALTVGLFGKSPFALRFAAFPIGILTVAATMAMGQALFSRRVGVLASAVLTVTLWHVHLSRVDFRAVLLPLFIALTAWQVALGVKEVGKTGRQGDRGQETDDHRETENRKSQTTSTPPWWAHWLLAGVFYGLSFYTYTAARFTLVALAALGLYVLITQSALCHTQHTGRHPLWRGLGISTLAALLTVAPLAACAVSQPDVVLGRPGQVSILNPAINKGNLWTTLGAHTLRTLGMFFVQGDRIWRHNVPWRPVFDPVLGLAFVIGLLVALRRARRNGAAGFVLIWTAVMSLPTLLAEDAPHFLRAVGMLPAVAFLPALGLDWLANALKIQRSELETQMARGAILVLPLLFGLVSTARAYFGDYGRDPMAGYWFERGATALAGHINAFLGQGWDGERMIHDDTDGPQVYLDPVLWAEWQPQIQFLVSNPDPVAVGLEKERTADHGSQIANPNVAVFAWPYKDWQHAWNLLPSPAEITVEEGPLSQGDRDPEPFTTYIALLAVLPDSASPPLARFSDGVELLGVEVLPMITNGPSTGESRGKVRVRLRWRATVPMSEDYTVFLHYLRNGELIGQADSRPAEGHYPTTRWNPGDVINDDHTVEGVDVALPDCDVLRFGFWQPESGTVLHLLDEAGAPAGDWIEVGVNG